jgi:HlyD family secretion protein
MPRPPTAARRNVTAATGTSASRQVWVLRDGQPAALAVSVGASDGRRTEVSSPQLKEGELVIVGQRNAGSKP